MRRLTFHGKGSLEWEETPEPELGEAEAALAEGVDPAAAASVSDNIVDAWRTVAPYLADDPGASVLVVGGAGPGSIGLYAAGIAAALGSPRVVYVDDDERRLAIARELGA